MCYFPFSDRSRSMYQYQIFSIQSKENNGRVQTYLICSQKHGSFSDRWTQPWLALSLSFSSFFLYPYQKKRKKASFLWRHKCDVMFKKSCNAQSFPSLLGTKDIYFELSTHKWYWVITSDMTVEFHWEPFLRSQRFRVLYVRILVSVRLGS